MEDDYGAEYEKDDWWDDDDAEGEGGELRPPAELCAGRAVARRQLGVAPEELAAGERKEEGGLSRGSEQELVQY